MTDLVDQLYRAADRCGFLATVLRVNDQNRGRASFREADADVLDGLGRTPGPTLTMPAQWFPGLQPGEPLEVNGQPYEVREVRRIGDGSEVEVMLARL